MGIKRNKKKFSDFMRLTISELKQEQRYGTAHIHQSALRAFCEFYDADDIYFFQITRGNLKKFETYLRNKQSSWNTVSTYMRALRSVYNQAADQHLTHEDSRLFSKVYTGVKNKKKRALEVEDMNKLLYYIPQKELPEELILCRVWVTLMFQLRGMPFVDLAHLHKKDLEGNTLSYLRKKTGGEMTVEVPPTAMELIKIYKDTNPDSPYLFPILSGTCTDEKSYTEYQNALRNLNYGVKRLAVMCGILAKVSSYTTRHTWATLAKYCNFSQQLISEAFGHSSVLVTEAYMEQFKQKEIDKANETIIRYVSTNGKKGVAV